MKNKQIQAAAGLLILVMMLVGCTAPAGTAAAPGAEENEIMIGNGSEGVDVPAAAGFIRPTETGPSAATTVQSAEDLTEEELEGLLLMREEEKLARDVYLALYEKWGTNIFMNIASSESTHMDAVGNLLARFGIEDPVGDHGEGVFENDELQNLYDQLVEQGSTSLESALRVGAAVEEIDIVDLEELLQLSTDVEILRVYGSLLAGSENHLRSFVRTLEQQTGETYGPEYLGEEAYDRIIGSVGSSGAGGRGAEARGSGQAGNRG